MDFIKIIQENSLIVRCLPYKTVDLQTYREGDELRKWVNSEGKEIKAKREVIVQKFDLEYFKNTPPQEWNNNRTPQQRLEAYLKHNPSGERKLLRTEKEVLNGGWWYVKETKNTDSTILFSKKTDKFFAPTLEEAMQMYLDSKNRQRKNKE